MTEDTFIVTEKILKDLFVGTTAKINPDRCPQHPNYGTHIRNNQRAARVATDQFPLCQAKQQLHRGTITSRRCVKSPLHLRQSKSLRKKTGSFDRTIG